MNRTAEDIIRNALDGTFTVINYEGRVNVLNVDRGFIPSHKPGEGHKVQRTGYALFTAEEDRQLIEMRRAGIKFEKIAIELWRGVDSCKKRHQMLCVRGVVKALSETN